MYFPSRKQLFSLTNHCTYAIPETGEFITCFEHGSRIYYLTNLGSTTFLKSVHLQDKTQETCNKISDSCGAPITFGRANDSFVFGENIFIFFGDWKVLRLNMRDRSIEDATKLVEELSGMDYLWSAQDDQAIYFEVSDNDENSSLWKLPICSEEPVSNSVIIANRDYLKCSACNGLVDKQKAFRCRTCIANNVMSAKIIFCGTCFTLQHNGHVFNNEEIVDNSTKLASLTSLGLSVVDMETLKTTLRQSLSEVIDLEITRNLETLEEKVELIEISKKRIQDDRSMTASDLQWNMEAIRELSSAADQELERIEMWKDRVLSAILANGRFVQSVSVVMELKSVLVVFCALALVSVYANEYRAYRERRAVAVLPGFGMMCVLGGYCGRDYKSVRNHHPDRRYGPYYHNQYIPRRKDLKRRGPHSHRGYYFG
ncbi:hypothetical protein QR680_004257 [Steinernema hermaphroditum]|uniref:Uncharacterized protein n=1 Tax=Steinernema hermaphroditum TaxID=289476 RepID=A0AA39HN48_9BILA|nr:hypothetical protein QR680_004257 [Steinernema hermaphroditum]